MNTKDIILYGALAYIAYITLFKNSNSIGAMPLPYSPYEFDYQTYLNDFNTQHSKQKFIINTPETTGTPQIEPTPASVLSPTQLQNFIDPRYKDEVAAPMQNNMGRVNRFPFTI